MKFIAVVKNKKDLTSIVKRLRMMGCTISQVLKQTGVIIGDSGKNPLSKLKLGGLLSIEEDRNISF